MRRFGMNAVVVSGQALLFVAGVLAIELLDIWSVGTVIIASVLSAGIGAMAFLFIVPRSVLFSSVQGDVKRGESFWRLSLPEALLKSSVDDSSANRFAFNMLVSKIIMLVTLRTDVWLMGALLTQGEIGLYNAASRFVLPLSFVVIAVGTALMPRVSALGDRHELRGLLRRTIRGSGVATILGIIYAISVPYLAPWLFGEPFRPITGLGQILCLGQCAVIFSNPISVVGYNMGLAASYWVIHLFQLGLVLICLWLFLPQFGAFAAAWTFLGSSVAGSALTAIVVWRKVKQLPGVP
jgi:O-antigen/teichoic acid export membrane protein